MSNTQSDKSLDEEHSFSFIIDSQNDRGQIKFCKNLHKSLFEPGISPYKTEFPDVKIKKKRIDHYLKDISKITQ